MKCFRFLIVNNYENVPLTLKLHALCFAVFLSFYQRENVSIISRTGPDIFGSGPNTEVTCTFRSHTLSSHPHMYFTVHMLSLILTCSSHALSHPHMYFTVHMLSPILKCISQFTCSLPSSHVVHMLSPILTSSSHALSHPHMYFTVHMLSPILTSSSHALSHPHM